MESIENVHQKVRKVGMYMKEYVLSKEEFLYLGALAGAELLYGVENSLSGLSEAELKLRIAKLEENLLEKGYLKEDFDGNKEIQQEILVFMEICAHPTGVLIVEKETVEEGHTTTFYHFEEEMEQVVKVECRKDNFHCIMISQEETWGILQCVVNWKRANGENAQRDSQKEEFQLSQKELRKATQMVKAGGCTKAAEIFRDAGASDSMIEKILQGLQHQADYYSFLFLDEMDETQEAQSVSFLLGEDFIIGMQPQVVDDIDYVEFYTTDSGALEELLRDGYSNIGLGQYAWADFVYDDAELDAEYEEEED